MQKSQFDHIFCFTIFKYTCHICHDKSYGYGTVLGQHGINTRNKKGVEALDLLQTHNLKAATTFHKHTKYQKKTQFFYFKQALPL